MSTTTMASTLNVRIDDDLEAQLQQFREQQRIKPSQSDVVRTALEEFLEAELDEV